MGPVFAMVSLVLGLMSVPHISADPYIHIYVWRQLFSPGTRALGNESSLALRGQMFYLETSRMGKAWLTLAWSSPDYTLQ